MAPNLMLSNGPINAQGSGTITYQGVPSPQPPAAVIQASIQSTLGGSGTQTFPPDLNPATMPTLQLQLLKFGGVNTFASGGVNGTNQISSTPISQGTWILPIPASGLVDNFKVKFEQDSLFEELGTMVQAALTAGGAAASGFKSGLAQAGITGAAIYEGTSTVASIASSIGKTVGVKSGTAMNPFQTLLLRGPQFKELKFSFLFAPKNPNESILLTQMLNTFRAAATPALTLGNFAWQYPMLWQFSFGRGGNQFLYKFKPAVCLDIGISYPSGQQQGGWFRPQTVGASQAPSLIQLDLGLLEAELWSQGDYGIFSASTSNTAFPTSTMATTNNDKPVGISANGQFNFAPGL